MKRRKTKLKRKFVLLIIVIGIVTVGAYLHYHKEDVYAKYNKDNKEVGKVGVMEEEDDGKRLVVYYPKFEEKELNDEINKINTTIKALTNTIDKGQVVYSDYQSKQYFDQYVTVHITTEIFNNNHKIQDTKEYYVTYDKKSSKVLTINDVLRGQYKQALQSKIKNIDENSKSILLDDNSIYLFTDDKKITIPYQEYKEYIKLQNKNIPSIVPKEITIAKREKVDPSKPMIAITFDDGPHPVNTKRVIKMFEKYNGKATFFMLGSLVEKYPEIVKEVYREGFEIANHSWSHVNLKKSSQATIHKEIHQTQDLIFSLIGQEPKYLRPPYGAYNDMVKKESEMQMILWTVDTQDWKNRDASIVKQRIIEGASDGAIILLHDIHGTSVDGIEKALPILKEKGYQLVTVDTLMKYKNKK